jgi:hypothetical protein
VPAAADPALVPVAEAPGLKELLQLRQDYNIVFSQLHLLVAPVVFQELALLAAQRPQEVLRQVAI